MKSCLTSFDKRRLLCSKNGSALVIVLGLLVLIVAMTMGFLLRISTERGSAASYSNAAAASRLVDTSVQLVQAQIEHASTRGDNTTWISQPGMVRTYNSAGTLQTAYKLYSAKSLTGTNIATLLSDDEPPNNWTTDPTLWTDLNAPVVSGGYTFFPILDPRAENTIPGFSVDSGWSSSTSLPMPVRWLYVLAKGEIIAPTSSSGQEAIFGGSPAIPTKDNPIIGRIAFWTDDESCKVNVNTASAPTFFDIPWFNSAQEQQLADSQPVRGEFQRYPGHPATVDLAKVIAPLLLSKGVSESNIRKQVLDFVPRLQEGGSLYGTKQIRVSTANAIILDTDRLYPSTDEIRYPAQVTHGESREVARTNIRPLSLTAEDLALLRFFLTAHSRSPELNPFGLPKVATWPLNTTDDSGHRTPFERLLARAASINGNPYYFQRSNSRDPNDDWDNIVRNQELFNYLDKLISSPLPGIGSSLGTKFGIDRQQILAEILDYIRSTNLFDENLSVVANRFTRNKPTVGGIPEEGHGFVAPLQVKPNGGQTYMGFGRFFTLSELAFLFICNADGYDDSTLPNPQDSPAITYPTNGQGATPAARLRYENYERKRSRYGPGYSGSRDPANAPSNMAVPAGSMLAPTERRVQMMILPELFSAMVGYGIMRPDMTITIRGLDTITLNGQQLFPNASETIEVTSSYNALPSYWPLGGNSGYRAALVQTLPAGNSPQHIAKGIPARSGIPADSTATNLSNTYSLVSNPVTIPTVAPPAVSTMQFSIGSLIVEISYGSSTTGGTKLVQTIQIGANSAAIPVPRLVAFPDYNQLSLTESWWGFHSDGVVSGQHGRIYFTPSLNSPSIQITSDNHNTAVGLIRGTAASASTGSTTTPGNYVKNTDVVRSLQPSHSDFRLVAAQSTVPAGIFKPLGNWADPNIFLMHTLHDATWNAKNVPGAIEHFGKYRSEIVSYGKSSSTEINARNPDFSRYATGTDTPQVSGDYDKGTGYSLDGPYINKPDEGNIYGGTTTIPYFNMTNPALQQFDGTRFFSPNRIIPSPGMFGSLPTHVLRNQPWRTLLFRPQPNHPDSTDPKDHLLMEFFWMPVVEPYAISEPFSTAGKVNMNYQIMPFDYINRSTALLAALSEERVTAAPTSASQYYNLSYAAGNPSSDQTPAQYNFEYRRKIDGAETLQQFQTRFNVGNIFRSASEICDLYLVPEGKHLSDMNTFWHDNALTSDNVRERVYTTLYPKLTVRSNIYTVHYKVQALKKSPTSPDAKWVEGKDKIVAEYRGSTTIERFIDPNDLRIPDYPSVTTPTSEPAVTNFYQWRTIRRLPFSP